MPVERFNTECYNKKEEELLEYVIAVADRFAPDVVIGSDGIAYEVDSQAPLIFKRRYNGHTLKATFTYSDYIKSTENDNESAIDIIRALGIDAEKFWYLLLFVADYVEGSTVGTFKCSPSPRKEIEDLIDFVEGDEDSVSNYSGMKHKQPMKLTLQIKGHRLIIENPNTISAIAAMCKHVIPLIGVDDFLNLAPMDIGDKSNSIRIWLFARMMRCFFDLYPQFTAQRRTGNATTKSTLRLISKLVYLSKFTANEEYCTDDENLKGILKQYRNYKIDTVNAIYG